MTLRRTTLALLVLYALLTIYPIVSIALGISPLHILTPVTTLVGFTFALLHAGQREGWGRALRLLAQNSTDIMLVQLPDSGDDSARTLRELRVSEGGRKAYCIALIPPEAEANVAKLMLAGASDYLLFNYTEASLLARLSSAQRVVALQSAVRASAALARLISSRQ